MHRRSINNAQSYRNGSLPPLNQLLELAKDGWWDQALARARDAEDPEEVLDDQLALTEQMYRDGFEDVPEDHLKEMLAVLEEEFRRRAGMD